MPSGPYSHGKKADDAENDVTAAAAADVVAADAVADIVVGVIVMAGLEVVMGPPARIFIFFVA